MARRPRRHHTRPAHAQPKPRRHLWLAGLVLFAAAGTTVALLRIGPGKSSNRTTPGRLNILLITADTTRADYLGCYGGTAAATPNLDRLARDGALFGRCSTAVVLTGPSHASILTGLYPFVHGLRRNAEGRLPAGATTLAEMFKTAGYATGASIGSYVLDPRFGMAQGFDTYCTVVAKGTHDGGAAQRKGNEVCDDALDFLRKHAQQRFFLWAHFYDPHYPYESQTHPEQDSPAAYADEISFMDTQIGRLLDALRDLKLEQQTLVVLIGDHGEGLGEHQEYRHGYFVYQTCERVPFLMRCPGVIPAGSEIPALVRTVDIAPTILELAGLSPLPEASGISLTPLLTGKATDLQLTAYSETVEPYAVLNLSTIRTFTAGPWKYIWSASPQLFDLAADPYEQRNVIGEHPDVAATLHEQLRALVADAPPRIPTDAAPPLGDAEVRRLETLGYVVSRGREEEASGTEFDPFDPQGPDPCAYTEVIHAYQKVRDLSVGSPAQAEALLRTVLAALPDAPSPQLDLARALRRQGKGGEAARVYGHYLEGRPSDTQARGAYASLLLEAGQVPEAVAQATEVLRTAPDDFGAHALLAVAYEKSGQLDAAREHLEAATRIQPQQATTQIMLGQLYLKLARYAEAAGCFRAALARQPNATNALEGLQAAERGLRK